MLTPSTLMERWLRVRTASAIRAVLTELRMPRAFWRVFWTAYSPYNSPRDRRSPAVHLAFEQHQAAEAALMAATAASTRLQAAVARTYTHEYWQEVYGGVERERVARRQARYLTTLAAPGWTADPHWRTSTVIALVRLMVESSDFSAIPILADALQDAGCDNDEWLALLRDRSQPWFVGARLFDDLIR